MKRLLCAIMLLVSLQLQAQDERTISGSYRYYVPANESLEAARHTAIQRARLTALAREFGETLSQTQAITTKEDVNGYTDALYTSGENSVNGEWLQDTSEPIMEQGFENGQLYIQVFVSGKARSVQRSSVEIHYQVLRNGTSRQFVSTDFNSGDQLYLQFQSPVSGFVAIYLIDETKTAYCLLPYRNQKNGSQKVEANRQYIFFNANGDVTNTIDEYELNCDDGNTMVFNELYIIFSENDFAKTVDYEAGKSQSGLELPRSLPFNDFLSWLNKKRSTDNKMQVVKETVSVKGE
ncbi:MAG: DUF4384 domain-containing protein [Salinivirgaceae bacterium]|nr:DUF4384 domain-containing protein [Salinivirgaceae bacterium]